MAGWLSAATIFFAVAVIAYLVVERRWRWRWQEVESGRVAADGAAGTYRDGGAVPRYLPRAPAAVRAAAFASLLLGQLFVPLAFIGGMAIVYYGLGVVVTPFLIGTFKIYRAGLTLLRRDPRLAYFRARDAAVWSGWACGVFLVGLVPAILLAHVTRKYEDYLFAATARPTAQGML
jgi:hypothetical protein